MKPSLEPVLKNLPSRPGVYIMKNASGTILYVGKSVNLKSRVNSYFNGTGSLNAAKSQMVGQITAIDWLETTTEVEALVLETNLIKKHRPKYNVLMKDDKNLSYIVFTDGPVSEVFKGRQKPAKGTYFGPYTSGASINLTLKNLRRIFRVRSCRMKFDQVDGETIITAKAGRTPPCMDYYIGLCPAPCLLTKETLGAHKENVDALKKFLRGQMSEVVEGLRTKMMAKAKTLEFEEAQKLKEQIESIGVLGERQVARDAIKGNADVVEYLEKYDKRFIGVTSVRWGEIQWVIQSKIEAPLEEETQEIVEQYLAERYSEELPIDRLITEIDLTGTAIEAFLSANHIPIDRGEIGPKADLLKFAKTNLMNFAYRSEMENLTKKTLTKATMATILTELGYEPPKSGPISFECYDNSHTNGQFTVASRSVIVNGKSENSLYRKYKLKTLELDKIDDFESMREIMERRTIEWLEQDNFPTLILIDGGKGQLSSALEWVSRWIDKVLNRILEKRAQTSHVEAVPEIPVSIDVSIHEREKEAEILIAKLPFFASLAKREEEIFVPDIAESIRFTHGSPELMLLQKIRDEAHRFAINFNRQSRSKAMKKNILEELPGFWPTTRKKLLKLAGSVDALKDLSSADILTVCTKTQLETLEGHGLWSEPDKR